MEPHDDRFGPLKEFFHPSCYDCYDSDDYEYKEDAQWARYNRQGEISSGMEKTALLLSDGYILKAWEVFRTVGFRKCHKDKEVIDLFTKLQIATKAYLSLVRQ